MFVSPSILLGLLFAGAAVAAPAHDGAELVPRAPGALSCRAIASGPWTLERERQQRQGLWVSPQKTQSFRLIGATNGVREGQDLTFYACDSQWMGFKEEQKDGEQVLYGQLRTHKVCNPSSSVQTPLCTFVLTRNPPPGHLRARHSCDEE
jgi:hypothetical protein